MLMLMLMIMMMMTNVGQMTKPVKDIGYSISNILYPINSRYREFIGLMLMLMMILMMMMMMMTNDDRMTKPVKDIGYRISKLKKEKEKN